MFRTPGGDRLVLSPLEPFAARGASEVFEHLVQLRLDRLSTRKSGVRSVEMPARHPTRERA